MPRIGYIALTLDERMMKDLDAIADLESCNTRPETIRLLIRQYKRDIQIIKSKEWTYWGEIPGIQRGCKFYQNVENLSII